MKKKKKKKKKKMGFIRNRSRFSTFGQYMGVLPVFVSHSPGSSGPTSQPSPDTNISENRDDMSPGAI